MHPDIIIVKTKCDSEATGFESAMPKDKERTKKQITNAIDSMSGYAEYVKKHGYHFTEALAEYASKMMINNSGASHSWTAAQVKKALDNMGYPTSTAHATIGDITYAANMLYADLYPEPLKDDASVLKGASAMACDPDGYDGMIFVRWTADIAAKTISVDWEKFI